MCSGLLDTWIALCGLIRMSLTAVAVLVALVCIRDSRDSRAVLALLQKSLQQRQGQLSIPAPLSKPRCKTRFTPSVGHVRSHGPCHCISPAGMCSPLSHLCSPESRS